MWFDWFETKQVIDLKQPASMLGVISIAGDFMSFPIPRKFNLVLCLQVLEHLSEPRPFCQKLFSAGQWLIISVPYKWSQGQCIYHKQDPVDEAKLETWTNRVPIASCIVTDNDHRRLISIYQGEIQ